MNTSYDRGLAVHREVLGDSYVEQAGARTTDFTRGFQALVTEFAWGTIWARPGLDRRSRSMITLTALVEAEAERERRAEVINARGELQASEELREAAETLSKNPASLQLRYLQTLLELGADQNSTVVFPLPVDIITPFLRHSEMLESIAGALNERR